MPCPGWAFPQRCKIFIPYVDDLPYEECGGLSEATSNSEPRTPPSGDRRCSRHHQEPSCGQRSVQKVQISVISTIKAMSLLCSSFLDRLFRLAFSTRGAR